MVKVEITGYKEIVFKGKTLYYLSAIAEGEEKGTEGLATYNAFVCAEHLKKHDVSVDEILGTKADYYTRKSGDTYKSGITFKNRIIERR